jgi:hypothetical protein
MRYVNLSTYLDRVFWALLGAIFALNVLTLLDKGDFRTEAVIVLVATLPFVISDQLKRRSAKTSAFRNEVNG